MSRFYTTRSVRPHLPLALAAGLAAVLLVGPPRVATAQDAPQLSHRYGTGDDFLFAIKALAAEMGELLVLTEPELAVHRFDAAGGRARASWGREGEGPDELREPVGLARVGLGVLVLDLQNHKLVQYRTDGSFVRSRPIDQWANRLFVVGQDTVLGSFVPMADERAVVRLRSERADTLLAYVRRGESLVLEAPGAPRLTVKRPFTPQLVWTVTRRGELVWYDPAAGTLTARDLEGGPARPYADVNWPGLPVSDAALDWWVEGTVGGEFQGRPIFEPLRPVARERAEFPDRLPPVLAIVADPRGGVWVRRSVDADGEIWRQVGPGADSRPATEIRLPVGRTLETVGDEYFFALAKDEFDIETVEAYAR